MRDDSEDERNANEQLPAVGYKQPPLAHRFQKGHSGNPRGRPKKKATRTVTHSIGDVEALMLEEAYRLVSIREGDKVIQMPAIQAAMRGLGVAAIKGNHRAQLAFKEHTEAIETKKRAEKQQLFEAMAEYKWKWEAEFERCDRLGQPRPELVPHPGDIQFDVERGEARCVGPFDDLQKSHWEEMHAGKQDVLQRINSLRRLMKREPKLRKGLEQGIAREEYIVQLIDYNYPDEATRRHPSYDPCKRGEPPEPPEQLKFGAPAKPVARATKAAARRRSKVPEE